MVTLGFYVEPWERTKPSPFRSIGRFYSPGFQPEGYHPYLPTPPFEDMTERDAFWGAKIVMSFTNEQIDAAVRTAQYSDHGAEAYVARVLKERRDIIGRYYFDRESPLDKFVLTGPTPGGDYRLRFGDLALSHGLAADSERRYRYSVEKVPADHLTRIPEIPLSRKDLPSPGGHAITLRICASRIGSHGWCRAVRLAISASPDGVARITGITR